MKHLRKAVRIIAAAAAITAVSTTATEAQQKKGTGAGIMLGEPTGLSVKSWMDDTHAIDGGIGVSLDGDDHWQIHADYLIHSGSSTVDPAEIEGTAPWYYGVGARVRFDDDTQVGVRIPLGITYLFGDQPIDAFAEVAPVLDVVPDVELELNAAIGVRYYF